MPHHYAIGPQAPGEVRMFSGKGLKAFTPLQEKKAPQARGASSRINGITTVY